MSWHCKDMCDSGIDEVLKELVYRLGNALNSQNVRNYAAIESILERMVRDRHEAWAFLAKQVQSRIEEVVDDKVCCECEDSRNETEQLRHRPVLNWEGRELEFRRDNVFVDTRTGDSFELTPSNELVSICQ